MTDHRFIFVGGMHRSGTTLVADLIASSDETAGFSKKAAKMGEGQHLQDVFLTGEKMGGPRAWALDPRCHLTEADVEADTFDRLWACWSPHWNLDKEVLVEKTPLNIARFRYLQELFPASRMVAITRNPIAQALAIKKWSSSRAERVAWSFDVPIRNWLSAHRHFVADQDAIDQLLVIRYEDLILDPVPTVERLEEFLGLTFDPDAVARIRPGAVERYQEVWTGSPWRRPLVQKTGATRMRSTSEALTERAAVVASRGRVARDFGDDIAEFGYDVRDLAAVTPWGTPAR